MASFHFTADSLNRKSRAEPSHLMYGELAYLHKQFDEMVSSPICSALRAMVNFNDQQVLTDPRKVIFYQRGGGLVEICKPYTPWSDGERCCLTRKTAHLESMHRRNSDYKPPGELIPERVLNAYAKNGTVQHCDHLMSSTLQPAPPLVSVRLGKGSMHNLDDWVATLTNLVKAHRDFRIQIHDIFVDAEKYELNAWYKEHHKRKYSVNLFKSPGIDPGGVLGLLEVALRKTKLLQHNLTSISSMSYDVQVQAWEANKAAILCENDIKPGKYLAWGKKKELLQDFQDNHDGISLKPPPKKSTKHKSKKRKVGPEQFECDDDRQGAAKASFKGLQTPQIYWGRVVMDVNSNERSVLICSSEYLNDNVMLQLLPRCYHTIIVLRTCNLLASVRDFLAESQMKLHVLLGSWAIQNAALLVQWLPLLSRDDSSDSQYEELVNLKAWCKKRLKSVTEKLLAESDFLDMSERQLLLKSQTIMRELPKFARACGMKDLEEVCENHDLIEVTKKDEEYWDPGQARRLREAHGKVSWMVTSHMK